MARPPIIDLAAKLATFEEPRIVTQMNEAPVELTKVEGDFGWHSRIESDEPPQVLEGGLQMAYGDGTVTLRKGEPRVVTRGVPPRPCAGGVCRPLLFDMAGTRDTGDRGAEGTAGTWI